MISEPLAIGMEKQLFIDDYCIETLQGVRRVINQPQKHPDNPLLIPEAPWEETYIALYGNVIYHPQKEHFEMWYSARANSHDKANYICHATSPDGVHWRRTPVNRLEHDGLILGNAVVEGCLIGPTVFYTPEDADPNRKYRMFVFIGAESKTGRTQQTAFGNGYGVLFSPDGLIWKAYEYNPVVQGGDIATCSFDPVTNEYIAFPKVSRTDGGIFRRCVGVSTSKDFLRWNASDIILSADAQDDARVDERLARFRRILCYDDPSYHIADMYGMTGFRYEGMRLGLIWFFDRSALSPVDHGGFEEGVINIQLAYSRDLNPYGYWHRVGNRGDFLPCGNEGDWDAGMVITAHTVVEREDELWFYYMGTCRGHGWEPDNDKIPAPLSKRTVKGNGSGLGLAKLRRDGFVSLDALYPEGTVTTKPIKISGDELEINADAENGQILVEITDGEGKPIPGYTKAEAVPLRADLVRMNVQWHKARLHQLQGRMVRLRFYVRTAKLYAFRVFS